jgi:hypothetical protein
MNAINEIMEKMSKLNDELLNTDIKKIIEINEKCVKCDMITKFSKIADDILKMKGDSDDEHAGKIVDLLFELVLVGEIRKATERKLKKRKVTLGNFRYEIEKSFMKKIRKYPEEMKNKKCDCDKCNPENKCDSEEDDDYIE